MTTTTEVASNIFQISTYIPEVNLQFNQFLVRDDEPLLFHTGMNVLFPAVLEAVKTIIDPATLRWISFSHFEADECGSLNQWLDVAPHAEPACSLVGVHWRWRKSCPRHGKHDERRIGMKDDLGGGL